MIVFVVDFCVEGIERGGAESLSRKAGAKEVGTQDRASVMEIVNCPGEFFEKKTITKGALRGEIGKAVS